MSIGHLNFAVQFPTLAAVGRRISPTRFLTHLLAQEDDTVRARRRRRSGPGGAPTERAAAPRRERPSAGGSGGSSGGGGGMRPTGGSMRPSSSGGIPGGGMGIGGVIIIIILVAIFGFSNVFQDETPAQPQADLATPAARPTTVRPATPRPSTSASSGGAASDETWTVMLYQDADDKVLEHDIYVDLNEAERVGSSDNVNIVAQIDRYRGGYDGDGNWTSAKRYYITQDDDLQRIASQPVVDLGEVNMADAETLVDFVTWAMQTYPADKYVLILSDHGMGWPGGWSDPTASGQFDRSIPLQAKLSDLLYLNEIDDALQQIRDTSGLDKLELIGLDACLMAHLEVFSALQPHARYAVASQETEPALGWAYTSFLAALVANPTMDGAELSQHILSSYIADDQRIVDDQARAELVGRGQPTGGLFDILLGDIAAPSAQQVAAEMGQNVTLAAVDLEALPALMASFNAFANELQAVSPKSVAQARSYAQSFTSIFGSKVPPSYIDLGHFAELFQKAGARGALGDATTNLLAAIDQAVIGETHGPKLPAATGISIYFPVSELYRTAEAGPLSYTAIANRFAAESLWDDYLAFHYTGRKFEANSTALAVPDRTTTIRSPVAGGITASPVTASADVAAPGAPVLLSTHIEGENVGYVYFFTGFYDSAANSILTADMDYLESDETGELNGVYYPIWPEDGSFNLEFEWEPTFFAISDGTTVATALFQPETYGAAPEDAVYAVDGTYTYVDGESRAARLYFSNGVLRQTFGFTNEDGSGAPREIIPQAGDRFTIHEQWMDLDANGVVAEIVSEAGETLTFGDQPFIWQEQFAPVGSYVVGFIIEDLDGNRTPVYTQIDVQ